MKLSKKVIIVFLNTFVVSVILGFVFSKLWFWFVVPIFQVQSLNIFEAIGIILLISLITTKTPIKNRSYSDDTLWEQIEHSVYFNIGLSIMALLYGWILSLLI